MSDHSEPIEVEVYGVNGGPKSTAKLLERLKEHHDFNVALPDPAVLLEHYRVYEKVFPLPPTHEDAPFRPRFLQTAKEHNAVVPTDRKIRVLIEGEEDLGPITIKSIKRATAKYFGIDVREFDTARRNAVLCGYRHVAFYLCKRLTPRTLPEIGRKFGGRDHTTVLHGVRKIDALLKSGNQRAIADIEAITAMVSP